MKTTIGAAYRPLRQLVADELRGRILRGELTQGSRVIEDRLAEELGVSRNPVREAIRLLESEGLVEVTPRKGVMVTVISGEEADDLIEVRAALEVTAVRRAATRGITAEIDAELEAVLVEGEGVTEAGAYERLSALNARFHDLLARASGNNHLVEVLRDLQNRLQLLFSVGVSRRSGRAWEEHRRILEAIRARDADWAEAEMRAHINGAAHRYQKEKPPA
ncbi:DNA-binding transcriptional regulator, GntR family [Parafrankia irregularis]|uniref:DNA-binding transcriptional regulator, GntR family n=1 Tax=Parafrankia irregularis TaxID=795642 RepID=A0A0S4QXJ3_9ACTN|nr:MULTISPECIES: GntR family transcriptional regulator [Parafrankia]MBE3201452.1 GntR family transcriptional regulator [Parafrankia sp. CH37]CUU60325.1 DNA-binding transcriptional regulator, GntR family [Parafrankia irregularis]